MSRRWGALLALAIAVVMVLSCAQPAPEPEEAAPKAMETGDDPTVVDAGHYTTEFENDRVRVVRIKYGPGETSVMHYHPEAVAVFLTPAKVRFELPDGSTVDMEVEAGQHEFTPAEQHLPTNIGEEGLELVLVELKGGGMAAEAMAETGADPVETDPDHYTAEFENDLVRVVRIKYGVGDESDMHYHPDSVPVFLNDQTAMFTFPDGTTQEMVTQTGGHAFIPGGLHQPKNTGDAPFELVLVELK